MKLKLRHVAAIAAVVGFLGFGGFSLASAAEKPSTTTSVPGSSTTAPVPNDAVPQADHPDDENCPDMGNSSTPSQQPSSSTSPSAGQL